MLEFSYRNYKQRVNKRFNCYLLLTIIFNQYTAFRQFDQVWFSTYSVWICSDANRTEDCCITFTFWWLGYSYNIRKGSQRF